MLSVNKPMFQIQLNEILMRAAAKAFEATIVSSGDDKTDGEVVAATKKTSLEFGKAFAQEASKDLADAITDFIKSAGINITYAPTTLVSPTGPVTGALTITPATAQIQIL